MCYQVSGWPHMAVVCVPSGSCSAEGKGGQQGKDKAIVPHQSMRQRLTHFHQGQMFWLAIAFARWGRKVRFWCGRQDGAGPEAGLRQG